MNVYVYMLRCADGSYYVGKTQATLEHRLNQHNNGSHGGYTASRRPVILVWHESFDRITDAVSAERRIKGWSRAKKEALIEGDWERIKRLSKRRG